MHGLANSGLRGLGYQLFSATWAFGITGTIIFALGGFAYLVARVIDYYIRHYPRRNPEWQSFVKNISRFCTLVTFFCAVVGVSFQCESTIVLTNTASHLPSGWQVSNGWGFWAWQWIALICQASVLPLAGFKGSIYNPICRPAFDPDEAERTVSKPSESEKDHEQYDGSRRCGERDRRGRSSSRRRGGADGASSTTNSEYTTEGSVNPPVHGRAVPRSEKGSKYQVSEQSKYGVSRQQWSAILRREGERHGG